MKVGLVIDAFGSTDQKWGCGGNTYTRQLYHSLQRSGLDVSLWSYRSTIESMAWPGAKLNLLNESQPDGVWNRLAHTTLDLLARKDELRKMDVIHSTSGSSVVALRHIARAHTRFVFDFRVPFANTQKSLNVYKRMLFQFCQPDWTIFVDPASLEHYKRLYHRSNCSYIPVATDLSIFKPHRQDCDRAVRLLFAGVLRHDKGLDDLLQAMEKVWQAHPEIELLIAGYGPLRDLVLEEVDRRNGKLKYLGFVPNDKMPELYNNVDVLVLPSHREGFSRTVLEGMACGLPVVTTAVGGLATLQDQEVGKIVKPRCPMLLAQAISDLVESKDLREACGNNAQRYVQENHTWERVTAAVLAIYAQVTASE